MTGRSFRVRFYDTEVYEGKRGTTYTVRWSVNGKRWGETYKTSPLADSFRATLLVAANNGEPFDMETGKPVSHAVPAAETTWYEFALDYVDMKWPRISANNRKNTAKTLTKVTIALLRNEPKQFKPVEVRRALREYAFNKLRRDEAPPQVRTVLSWVQRNSLPMSVWEDTKHVDRVMLALSTLLDGKRAAGSSVNRERRILNVVIKYAIRQKILKINPLPKGKDENAPPKVSQAIDKRSLLSPAQTARFLAWIAARPRTGYRLHAFFATLYYAGLRPEEAVALRVAAATLPESGWGELLVHTTEPEVGSAWTDDGAVHETRDLKGRADGDTRPVPVHPALAAILRDLIKRDGLGPGDLLFPGEKGGLLSGSVFRRIWRKARKEVLTLYEFESPLGRRVYDLRDTCLTTWLNNQIPPAQVAEWAGNSVPVLLATYARCINGQLPDLQKRIEGPQQLPTVGLGPASPTDGPESSAAGS
ncbi:mobile element protein [Streptomyces eurocidicus]|uniref:Integrase n=1 Tax=Streptomyces eurocidicus TaxID=66423 RepID=A0A2N8P2Z4_STREU|nr:tyrosine-type recombinase/integrase [Streptomyces eurocidicus]MBB5117564.1 integrase [Streptomyces eurocidicus]MBF6053405.1 tyrosine-type recombinase/integrase [Streptomyces eurocidicus]PNE35392.1 mobile element protein [Streptomyces eurocidicus]